MANITKKLYGHLKTTPNRLLAWSSVTLIQGDAYLLGWPPRDALPEPFDIGDHAGNVNNSLLIGVIAGHIAARIAEHWLPAASQRTSRSVIFAGAVAVGAIANGLVETKFGQKLLGDEVMQFFYGDSEVGPDTSGLDVAYGVAAAGAASFAIIAHQKYEPASPDVVSSDSGL